MPQQRPVVVVGLMGAGKTTVGRRLAQALGRAFHDSDEQLSEWYGATASEQYQRHGVERLHQREADQLRRSLAARPAPVVAAAASVIDNPQCRAALADAYVVWLDAPPAVLARRVGGADHRPRYDPDPRHMLARQYERRAVHFAAVADLRLDVERLTPDQTVAAALSAITGQPGAALG